MSGRYEPKAFWDRTLADDFNLPGVALATFPQSLNEAWYRTMRSTLDRMLADEPLPRPLSELRILDVGPGIGMWVDFWLRKGARRVVGLDISSSGFARLRERFPSIELVRGDVGDREIDVRGPFDVISVVSVLLHVADDTRWRQAIANLAQILASDGLLLVVDVPIATEPRGAVLDETSIEQRRHLSRWRDVLAANGLRITQLEPATVLLSPPVEARTRLSWNVWWLYWRALMKVATGRDRVGRALAAPLGFVDRLLVRVVPRGPAAKCLAIRHRD